MCKWHWFRRKDKKLTTKPELKAEQANILKLQAFDSYLFIGQSYFIIFLMMDHKIS